MIELGKWLSQYGPTTLWMIAAALIGYLVGLARPLYCARCRRHMTAEDSFRAVFYRNEERREEKRDLTKPSGKE
jgi:hypothetical protein